MSAFRDLALAFLEADEHGRTAPVLGAAIARRDVGVSDLLTATAALVAATAYKANTSPRALLDAWWSSSPPDEQLPALRDQLERLAVELEDRDILGGWGT